MKKLNFYSAIISKSPFIWTLSLIIASGYPPPHIEEIFVSKMVIPCLYVRVDRIYIHYKIDFRVCEILFINIYV